MSDTDASILDHIKHLVEEEHTLRGGDTPDAERLRHLEEQLDQAWDLLRQRRARREFDQDEQDTSERSASTVENYRQ